MRTENVKRYLIPNDSPFFHFSTMTSELSNLFLLSVRVPASVSLCGENIVVKEEVCDLGVLLDSNLSMANQVAKICKICSFHLRRISLVQKYLTTDSLCLLVSSFVLFRLDYANSLLAAIPGNLLSRLQRVQNSAARLLAGVNRKQHITPVLRSLHWLPVRQRISYKLACLVFKSLHGLAPCYLCELLELYKPARAL